MNIINIQSITDIVTNSSTEVFIRIKETAINTVKELINNLLKISGSTLQADDLFTIEILYDDSSDLMVTPKTRYNRVYWSGGNSFFFKEFI